MVVFSVCGEQCFWWFKVVSWEVGKGKGKRNNCDKESNYDG